MTLPPPALFPRRLPAFCDVAIVGGGPAGAALAHWLGQHGSEVVVLEKKRFPRCKPCGEFLSPECLPLLADLGVGAAVSALGVHLVEGMVLHGTSRTATGRFVDVGRAAPPLPHGWAVRRERLDAVLLQHAAATPGVQVCERGRVVGLLRNVRGEVCGVRVADPDGEHELRAAFVVGADGLRSVVARELGVQRTVPWLDKVALTTRYAGVPVQPMAEVHFFPGGYFAATTVDAGLLTLNLVVERRALRARDGDWDGFLRRYLERVPKLACRLRSAVRVDPVRGCGPLAMTTTAQTFAGAALVGDACGYVDPVTGEGIFFALRGAQMLAPVLAAAVGSGRRDTRVLTEYARARRAEFAPRLFLARMLQRGLQHPRLVEGVLGLLARRPRLADLLVAVTGDYVPGRELLRPSVWWRALGAAS